MRASPTRDVSRLYEVSESTTWWTPSSAYLRWTAVTSSGEPTSQVVPAPAAVPSRGGV
jgi:hypothetical protein